MADVDCARYYCVGRKITLLSNSHAGANKIRSSRQKRVTRRDLLKAGVLEILVIQLIAEPSSMGM